MFKYINYLSCQVPFILGANCFVHLYKLSASVPLLWVLIVLSTYINQRNYQGPFTLDTCRFVYFHFGQQPHRMSKPLQWRHNGPDGVSNHQPHDYLLDHLLRRRSKKISKLRVTGLYAGNSPVTGEFPAQRASNAENFSIWWRHHDVAGPLTRHHHECIRRLLACIPYSM